MDQVAGGEGLVDHHPVAHLHRQRHGGGDIGVDEDRQPSGARFGGGFPDGGLERGDETGVGAGRLHREASLGLAAGDGEASGPWALGGIKGDEE